jgi:hypothetical protein
MEARWRALSEEVITGMAEWWGQHPRATLTEIEAALDEGEWAEVKTLALGHVQEPVVNKRGEP